MSDIKNNNMNTNGSVPKAKTRMCNNLSKGGQCPYGKKCHFAHDVKELQVQICGFGDKCVFVRVENGIVINSPNSCKVCRFMHPTETEAGYARRIYISTYTAAPALVVSTTRQTNILPLQLDLSAKKPIDGGGWTNIQPKKTNVEQPQVRAMEVTKTMNSFSVIDNRSEHIVANVNAENLLDHLDEWGDDDVKDIKLTVNYFPGAKVFEPNIGGYVDVVVRDY